MPNSSARSRSTRTSTAAIALAAVVTGLRWTLLCGALLASGYVVGLALNGYTWGELKALKDADAVVANTGGYLIAAYFFAAPVRWLGGYVARQLDLHVRFLLEESKGGTLLRSYEKRLWKNVAALLIEIPVAIGLGDLASEEPSGGAGEAQDAGGGGSQPNDSQARGCDQTANSADALRASDVQEGTDAR